MNRSTTRVLIATLLVSPWAPMAAPAAAGVVTFDVIFTRRADAPGPGSYDVTLFPSFGVGFGSSVVAPDGTVFSNAAPVPTPANSNLTFDQLVTRFTGEWTVNDNWPFLPNPGVQSHHFTIEPFAESDLMTAPPTITSVSNGQIVPPVFDVHWEWPGGVTPSIPGGSGVSITYSGGNNDADYLGDNTYQLTIGFDPGVSQRNITIAAGSYQDLTSRVTNIVAPVANPNNTIQPHLRYRNYSARVTVTAIVPEPGAKTLLAPIALLGLLFVTQRRRWPAAACGCVSGCDG
jgi:hypothetical protein